MIRVNCFSFGCAAMFSIDARCKNEKVMWRVDDGAVFSYLLSALSFLCPGPKKKVKKITREGVDFRSGATNERTYRQAVEQKKGETMGPVIKKEKKSRRAIMT